LNRCPEKGIKGMKRYVFVADRLQPSLHREHSSQCRTQAGKVAKSSLNHPKSDIFKDTRGKGIP